MDCEFVQGEIERGVRRTLNFAGRLATEDEFADYVQEAWVRYLSTQNAEEQANPWLCAKRSTAASMRGWTRKVKPLDSIVEQQQEAEHSRRDPMPEAMRSALLEEFLQQRNKGGERGLWAAARDVAILNLLWQGYGDKEIEAQLDMRHYSLRTYRRQIKIRLQHMLARKSAAYCPAWASSGFSPKGKRNESGSDLGSHRREFAPV